MNKLALAGCISFSAILTAALPALAGGLDSEIAKGDTRAFVLEILGEPDGTMGSPRYEVLFYPRGKVVLSDGKVVEVNLISEDEAARREAARIREEQERRRAAAQAEARRDEAAEKARERAANDKAAAASQPAKKDEGLTKEQQAELNERIAQGISEPPITMSRSKLRRFRRGRSPSQTAEREQQITDAFMAELKEEQGK